jgi:PPOX class probable F420-dependent enzyme
VAELTQPILDFLTFGTRTGKLGWVAPDGRPLVAPVWFVVEGDDLLFNTGADTAKGKALARDPRAVLTVDLEEPPYAFVQIQGVAEVTEELGEVRRIATLNGPATWDRNAPRSSAPATGCGESSAYGFVRAGSSPSST